MAVRSGIHQKLGTFELVLFVCLIWNKERADGATCDYLNGLRDPAQLEEGNVKFKADRDKPIVDLPLCLIKPGYPCLALKGKHADIDARYLELDALDGYAMRNGFIAFEGARKAIFKAKPRTSDMSDDLDHWEYIRDEISRWSCTSAKCEFRGEEGICAAGSRSWEIWTASTELEKLEKMNKLKNKKEKKTGNKGQKNGSWRHISDSFLSLTIIGFLLPLWTLNRLA